MFRVISLLAILFFTLPSVAATLVTQTVGQVGEYVLTSREVQISTVIESLLYPSAKRDNKTLNEVRVGQESFNAALTAVLLEAVVSMEAENFNVGAITDADLAAATSTVQKAVAGKTYWNDLEVSPGELTRLVKRKIESKNFLKFKTNSMSGIISDQEAQAYYDKNRVKFGSLPFASFKDNIKTFLSQQQLEERLRSWFEVIKRKYKVRNFLAE